ncbi:MAG: ABC transporter permease [Lachnospiraceae bacterium]|nr:ABC transporter permease [Lachnospiraceae bacterium]
MKGTFQRKYLGIPYALYLLVFVVLPLIVIVKYAFTDASGRPGVGNFINFFTDPNTLGTLMYSLFLAFATTLICLLIAYPAAYALAMSKISSKSAILMLMIMPMWINFTLRITALKELLTVIEGNLALHPFANSVIGMTYDFLPFMILPIYNQISRIDKSLLEAASDLGADSVQAFLRVLLPLSMPGVISGISMVFLPAMTNYVVLDMLYNSTYIMGSLIGSYFSAYDWHGGSTISLILLVIICIFTLVVGGNEGEKTVRGGSVL